MNKSTNYGFKKKCTSQELAVTLISVSPMEQVIDSRQGILSELAGNNVNEKERETRIYDAMTHASHVEHVFGTTMLVLVTGSYFQLLTMPLLTRS